MLRSVKMLGCLAGAVLALQSASAFSLLGPIANAADAYQVNELSYNQPGDLGAPKNLGEEYRLNTPHIYWAADSSFLDYFGSNGLHAIEQAFSVFNNLTNVSSYSTQLTEFPLDTTRMNFTAQALNLLDVKSAFMSLVLEHMGLAEPERWVWALRTRINLGTECFFLYHVIQRNYDPVTWEYSRYVNGTQYTYSIFDNCPIEQRADALEIAVDPLAPYYTSVASFGFDAGMIYTGLTRDDIGGLRYLYRTNNVNFETPSVDTLLYQTNQNPQLLFTSNLTLLASQALTNNAAQLQALYPGLVILYTSNYFQNVLQTNVVSYLTNSPWDPVGSPPRVVSVTNYTPTIQTLYTHLFGNIEVVHRENGVWTSSPVYDIRTLRGSTRYVLTETRVETPAWAPVLSNSFVTNITTQVVRSNTVVGNFFIVPSNSCGFNILNKQLTFLTPTTNVFFSNTNFVTGTNGFITEQVIEQALVEIATNYAFVVQTIDCITNSAALRQGIEKVTYHRRDFDSLLGRFFVPITNDYQMTAVVSNQPVVQRFRRVITAPDIVVQASDIFDPDQPTFIYERTIQFGASNLVANLAGPGTIEPFMTVTFNKIGPVYWNNSNFSDESSITRTNILWASFDTTTNAPIVYPYGRTIKDLENQIFITVTPAGPELPDAAFGIEYGDLFEGLTVTGGQPPYVWSEASKLPKGLYLSPSGVNGEKVGIFGAPEVMGRRTFVIRVTDHGGRFVDVPYTVTIW